jgi:putative transposase
MGRIKYITGEYYHIYNRGVERRNVFLDEADYFRFILGMREFNDINSVFNLHRLQKTSEIKFFQDKKPLVKFVCYSLMPNHFHFLLRQLEDGGISKFMQKLGTGYTKYFNKRYERDGVLFQGVFKAKHIPIDEYLLHLSRYIHLNVLSLIEPDWVSKGVEDKSKAYQFLRRYKWHSLPFWLEDKPNLIKLEREIVLDQFLSKKHYKDFLLDWVGRDLKEIKEIVIEG